MLAAPSFPGRACAQQLLPALLLLFLLVVLTPAKSVGYPYDSRTATYSDYFRNNYQQEPRAYSLPTSNSGKIKVFLLCKPECRNKCEHSIYESRYNTKGQCHTCLMECMSATTQQAKNVGVDFSGSKNRRMLRDDPFGNRARHRRKKRKKAQLRQGAAVSSSLAIAAEPKGQAIRKNYFTS